ncbi:MAG: lysine N(6)-hydroxylase/L-ornithine N(5)-oxygenase family protein [Richelia sp. RM2_1_2]|nr:lysine N(6)-hydroxylase/L-ornithine N(5)-oxygenase family protein [Richelia sp. SM1_7_0]NJN09033.1 lysine N(6)-hydroxylase/L-ornithine N(5)-oxygenase family protein [Richelia sp. RM1_1_1]NJO27082.1 lysine N(6)-hydroxylase/L-ornithine N(5)-oxygenase family protein [Richelia sp. SL_2_1]NJO57189.1 lysine N(6)-hydroxylase/L-ornithine N(5)-oxygenase family protein [Richelia sp. RM2_1_2]
MESNPPHLLKKIDLAIIGAGPHALTLVAHLLQKRQKIHSKIAVFDPNGKWMNQWEHQFAALEIAHLRSPAVHHPDPNPFALRKFAESRGNEFYPPYDLPGTRLFNDFCQDVIHRCDLENIVIGEKVTRIQPLHNPLLSRFRLWLGSGESILARRVVLATGSSQIQIPDWVNQINTKYPEDKLIHSHLIDLRQLYLAGERVLIIGGGLTSGHLAVGAISRGAEVQISMRRQLQEKIFDADAGWLGPKYLKGFFAESNFEQRFQMIQQARNGGSMTPAMGIKLRQQVRHGKLKIQENIQVVKAEWTDNHWLVKFTDGSEYECERIWLSTGTRFDVNCEPLLEEVSKSYPIPVVNGLPVLDGNLQWKGCSLFIMGGLAALQVGPTARNLSGARMASEKMLKAIIKSHVVQSQAKSA